MKSESLTKEKEKTVSEVEFYNNKGLLDVKIKSDGNAKEVFTAFEKSDVKSAVQLVLKEIEEEKNFCLERWNITKNDYWRGRLDGLIACENLIKKAFSGVIEE